MHNKVHIHNLSCVTVRPMYAFSWSKTLLQTCVIQSVHYFYMSCSHYFLIVLNIIWQLSNTSFWDQQEWWVFQVMMFCYLKPGWLWTSIEKQYIVTIVYNLLPPKFSKNILIIKKKISLFAYFCILFYMFFIFFWKALKSVSFEVVKLSGITCISYSCPNKSSMDNIISNPWSSITLENPKDQGDFGQGSTDNNVRMQQSTRVDV